MTHAIERNTCNLRNAQRPTPTRQHQHHKHIKTPNKHIKQTEARARAVVLEMVGDLPEADAAPPANVLFVCKLNPVTTEEDLEIIFSR